MLLLIKAGEGGNRVSLVGRHDGGWAAAGSSLVSTLAIGKFLPADKIERNNTSDKIR